MIQLKPIDTNNFWDVISLQVADSQQDFVTSNSVSIAQSKIQPECIPLVINHDDIPVGFLMYCLDQDDHEYWIYRLMIDQAHQGKGYGRKAMELVLDLIKLDTSKHQIFLGVDIKGERSVKLYESLGFRFTGKVYGKEHIMFLTY